MKTMSSLTITTLKAAVLLACVTQIGVAYGDADSFSPGLTLADVSLPANPKKSATSVTVIDKKMIEASGARSLGDILRIVPGVTVGYRFGHSLSIGTQGGAEEFGRRINMIVDGRGIFTPTTGTLVSFNIVPLKDIERIEVYRGPAHSEFGSNSMLLTIKIFTAYAEERQGTTISQANGTNGIDDTYIQHGTQLGDVFVSGSYSRTNDEGLVHRADDTHKQQIFGRADYQPTEEDQISATFGAAQSDIDVWTSSNLNSDDHGASDSTWFVSTSWTHMIDNSTYFTSNFSHTYLHRKSDYLTAPVSPAIGRLFWNIGYDLTSTAGEFTLTKNFDFVELSGGYKYSHDQANSDTLFKDDSYNLDYNTVFTSQAWKLTDKTTLNTGFEGEASSEFDSRTSSLSVSLVHDLDINNTFRVGFSKGTRLPLLYEQESARKAYLFDQGMVPVYDVYNTVDLEPEKMRTYELAWMYSSLDKTVNSEIRYYVNKYDNMIGYVVAPNPGIFSQTGKTVATAQNLKDSSTVRGVEASIDWRPTSAILLAASGSYTDVDSHVDPTTYTSNIGESSPTTVFTLMGQYSFANDWRVGGMYNRVQGFAWSNGWMLDTQHNLDMFVEKCFGSIGATKVCTKLSGSNLLGGQSNFRPEAYSPKAYWMEASVSF
ncbi:TonB-dependent receptor plug domain-containing protein [Pseudomonas sp. S1(2024)]|uniref:TonB-dependent receptor plug domain-containing protein n=1 Tax=Pseudomonas sp. S1(2024) TaxID=3390191 RepID=UPI00397C4AE8